MQGILLFDPHKRGVPKDAERGRAMLLESLDEIRRFANDGDRDAQYILGKAYYGACGIAKAEAESDKWMLEAAERGHALAQYNEGMRHLRKKEYAEAVEWFRKSAEQGNAVSQEALGSRFRLRQGVEKDEAEAVAWYRKAAEQGYDKAQARIGAYYAYGLRGAEKDEAEGLKWLRKAAGQGNAAAQFYLGDSFLRGELGLEQNHTEAVKWFREAAEQGLPAAQAALGECCEKGLGTEKSASEAAKWYRRAADQGDVRALHNLAMCHMKGCGVPRNVFRGVRLWCSAVAAKCSTDASKKTFKEFFLKMGSVVVVGAFFLFWFLGAGKLDSRRNPATRRDGRYVLTYGYLSKSIAWLYAPLFLGCLYGITQASEDEIVSAVILIIVVFATGLWFFLECYFTRIEFDDAFLYTRSPWRASRTIPWSEVTDCVHYPNSGLKLKTQRSGTVQVSAYIPGWKALMAWRKKQTGDMVWPQTVEEATVRLLEDLSEKDKRTLQKTRQEKLKRFRNGWSVDIQCTFGLLLGNHTLLEDCGTENPTDDAMLIIKSAWERLRQ